MKNKTLRFSLFLVFAQLLLIVVSWLWSAASGGAVRSLISSEGIRWFLGSFQSMVAQPPLVWLLLLLAAWGAVCESGFGALLLAPRTPLTSRQQFAIRVACAFLFIYVVVILLLTLPSHAILLSAAGRLFPSPFSRSIVPVVAFAVILVSLVYGRLAGTLSSLSDAIGSLSLGISRGAPVLILYIMLIQFYESLRFVFT